MATESGKPATILVVDDDELILSTLRGLFLLETDYEVVTHSDPAAALSEAEGRPVEIVISDFLMPRMNGVEFLTRLKKVQPEAIRILLTGFADKENAIRAINEVGLYQYIEKPWKNEDLLLTVRNGLSEHGLRRQLRDKVGELDGLIRDHRDLSDRHRSLEQELDMAAKIQRSLLPEELPASYGYRCTGFYHPSTAVGGDYYDCVRRPDADIVLVADTSGHGVQAALTSMLLKAIFQEQAVQAENAESLLKEMNLRLHQFLPSSMFACAAIAWISADSSLHVTNAGLPYPYLLRKGNEKPDELPLSGMPLGLFPGALPNGYDSRALDMEPGDLLLLATDGLGEIRGSDDRFFQDSDLAAALSEIGGSSGEELLQHIMKRAEAFAIGSSYDDDVTIVAITRE
ncbi:MAG: SpoIIE family protein phosphatase [Acidobacteria bacterium]|nr:SpoIIE family protein phosphatase [Acidobacteriota bacterium]